MSTNRSDIILENAQFRVALNAEGRVLGIVDKARSKELCASPGQIAFCSVQWGQSGSDAFAREYEQADPNHWMAIARAPYEDIQEVTHLAFADGHLRATFGNTGVSAVFAVSASQTCVTLTVVSVSGRPVDALTVAALPVCGPDRVASTLNACWNGRSVVCLMALTPRVQCAPDISQPGRAVLKARCSRQFGVIGEKVALIGCADSEFKKVIQDVAAAFGLPSPKRGGVWARDSEDAKRSYLFVEMKENELEGLIDYANIVPFGAILINVNSWAESEGHYRVHPENFPDGEESLKRTVAQIHEAGMNAGLHMRCTVARKNDPYVTPVPDPRLVRQRMITLADAVDEKSDFLPTTIAPVDFPSHQPEGANIWTLNYGRTLQIGQELITYQGVSLAPPCGFVGCQRGAWGTQVAAHAAGEPACHLLEIYGDFICDADTDMLDQIADRVAALFDRCGFDMLYLDASERLQGPEWYYMTKVQLAYYDKLSSKDIFVQGSDYTHYTWHMMARCASADGFRDVKGYLDRRLPSFDNYLTNFMPLDLGWYAINQDITLDDWEYICNKALGFGASVSVHTTRKALDGHRQTQEILALIRDYEEARLSGALSQEELAELRKPGKQYHLERAGKAKWAIRPV